MTAPTDTTSAMIAADAKTLADRAFDVVVSLVALGCLAGAGAVIALVGIVWGAR